jgi:hypothetical protein
MTNQVTDAQDLDDTWGSVTRIHTIVRDSSPEEGRHHSADIADPMVGAMVTILAATILSTIALVLRNTRLHWLVAVVGVFVVGIIVVFCLIVGRALVRDHLIRQWQSKRQAWRELAYARRSSNLLYELIATLDRDHDQGIASALEEFATISFALVTMVDRKSGVIVARKDEGHYVAEHVRGSVGDRRGLIEVGKRCPANRPFGEILERLAPHSLTADVRTAGGEVYFLGVLLGEPLDTRQNEVLSVVQPAFRLAVRIADTSGTDADAVGKQSLSAV